MVTDVTSKQYQLINNDKIIKYKDGFLKDQYGYVGIAIGSYYANNVGERFIMTFEDGHTEKFIVLDMKADKDTLNGANHLSDKSMIEFVVNVDLIAINYPLVIRDGNFNSLSNYNGNIIKVEKVVGSIE